MHRIRFARSRALAGSALWTAGIWLFASACGPGVATPMPEPPVAFDLGGVNNSETVPVKHPLDPEAVVIPGGARTVPGGAVVRITNLDRSLEVTAVNATPQGSFEAVVFVSNGEELRFEWVKGAERSAPADAVFVRPDPAAPTVALTASPRFDCLQVTPGYVLPFAGDSAVLGFENDCDEAVTLENLRTRLGTPDFALPAAPPEIAPGASVELTINLQPNTARGREDVLLIDVTLGADTLRYPITLRSN
jgi:hypothetical protein